VREVVSDWFFPLPDALILTSEIRFSEALTLDNPADIGGGGG
jgi:hypothetical protein